MDPTVVEEGRLIEETQQEPMMEEQQGGLIDEEEPQGRLIEVDEEVKIHIDGLEYQLKQNEQTILILQQKSQEACSALETSNSSLVLLNAELDSSKEALNAEKEKTQAAENKHSELQIQLQRVVAKNNTVENQVHELQEQINEYARKYREQEAVLEWSSEDEEKAPAVKTPVTRVHNTRRKGPKKDVSTKDVKPVLESTVVYEPGSLRFCRTCGASQLFRVKNELVDLFSGKKQMSKKSCAICGNKVAPPKKRLSKPLMSTEIENKYPHARPGQSSQKRSSQSDTTGKNQKKRKMSSSAADDLLKIVDGGGDEFESDNENHMDEGTVSISADGDKTDSVSKIDVDDKTDLDIKTDLGDKTDPETANESKPEVKEGRIEPGEISGDVPNPDDPSDPDYTPALDEAPFSEHLEDDVPSDSTKENVEEEPTVLPTNRRPGRPRKSAKEKNMKKPRIPSDAPPSSNLADLCQAEDDGTLFSDGRKKENRLQYALQGLDPLVVEMMDKRANDEAPFKCKQCKNVEFTHVKAFLRHMSTHTGEKPMTHPYRCESCNKKFVQSRVLQIHLVSHADDRPYKCKFCDAAFKIRSGLWRHVKIHTAPKQHLCNICGQRFQEKRKLQNHEMIHSGELPYKCPHCGEGFRRIESMRRHEKVHTGERPHVCEFCGRSFKERGDIKKHLVLHTGEKPYQCNLCSYRSNRKEYVKLHMKTHGSGAVHKCSHCELTFSSNVVCKKHEKEHFEPVQKSEIVESVQELKVQEEVIPTTLIINQGDHPHQEMLSAVDFLLQFDSANRVFATPASHNQDGTVTYVTQTPGAQAADPEGAVAYVSQSELTGSGQEGMVTYVAQHTTSVTGEETVTYVTEAPHGGENQEATTVAYITEAPNPEGGDQEATVTYVTQNQ